MKWFQAGICSKDNPDALIIALEPEAAAVWCKNLRFDQLDGKQITKENYMTSNQGRFDFTCSKKNNYYTNKLLNVFRSLTIL